MWGPVSLVRQAVLDNCEKIYGIDPKNLIIAMPFWERSGNKTYNFGSDRLYGAINGSPRWLNGLHFSGDDSDYVEFSETIEEYIENVKSFSIVTSTVWGSSTEDETIFDVANETGAGWWHEAIIIFGDEIGVARNDTITFHIGVNNEAYRVECEDGIKQADVKHHIVATFNANGTDDLYVYINGIADPNSGDLGPENTDTTVGLVPWIGKSHSGAGAQKPHQGQIDHCYFFTNAITAEQANLFYSRPHALFDPISKPVYHFLEAEITLSTLGTVQSNLSGMPTPQLNLLLNPLNSVLDELGEIVELQRDRIVDPKSAVHDQLANIVTILALKSLSIQSAIHEQLASVTDLTKESTLAIQNALHEQFATILTLTLPGIITLVIQNALHGELAKKANFSIAMLLRPQSAIHEQKVLTEILQLLQKLTAQSAYHDFYSEVTTLPGIVLVVKNAVHDALAGKLNIARERLLDVDSAVQDLINDIPDLATAYQLIVLNAVCSLIVGRPILTEEELIALYTYVAKNQTHIYTAKNQTHHFVARNYE